MGFFKKIADNIERTVREANDGHLWPSVHLHPELHAMSEKPIVTRDWALHRIARALGVAGYTEEECDSIMAWVQAEKPENPMLGRTPCGACGATGRREPVDRSVASGAEMVEGLEEGTRFLIQGVCLACRGLGFHARP